MKPLSVYVHIPFCFVKCGYCDFNAYAGMDALKPRYAAAVLREIEASPAAFGDAEVVSIAFGGGTPGEMPASNIAALIRQVRDLATVAPDAEVSLEANPGTSTAEHFADLRRAGVTRLSLGAQSMDPENLRFLDRVHSVEAVRASVRGARAAGFESVGMDMIYGLPGQSVEDWRADLDAALALGTDHLSLYCLTVEEGTMLHRRVERGEVILPSPDEAADMYDAACERLEACGFEQYELSNWARPGHRSRHNLGYWTGRDYLGFGAGAHGYVDGERYDDIAHPRLYIEAVEAGRVPRAGSYRPAGADAMADWLSLRLRLVDGFDPAEFDVSFGLPLAGVAGPPLDAALRGDILERSASGWLRLTRGGRLLHGELCARLLRYMEDHAVAGALSGQ